MEFLTGTGMEKRPLRSEGLAPLVGYSRCQRHDSVREVLHALQGPRLRLVLQVHHHVADAQSLIAFDVVRDLLRRASQGAALTIGERLGLLVVQPIDAVREIQRRRVASRLLRVALDSGRVVSELLRRPHGEARVAADGIPGVGEASRTSHRHRALAADPDGWVRFLDGFGAKATLAKRQYLPSNVGVSLVHSSLKARMYSSLTVPRSSYAGAPIASNSSRIQPTPQPTMRRPLESTSSVASVFAVSTGGRCGSTRTDVSSFTVDVTPTKKLRSVSCSMHAPDGSLANVPLSL